MTPEQIIDLARLARVPICGRYDETGSTTAELQRFAELLRSQLVDEVRQEVRNQTLEEAAKVCDERFAACPQVLADAIRNMKK